MRRLFALPAYKKLMYTSFSLSRQEHVAHYAFCCGACLCCHACERAAVRVCRTRRFPHLLVPQILQQSYSNIRATSASHLGPGYGELYICTSRVVALIHSQHEEFPYSLTDPHTIPQVTLSDFHKIALSHLRARMIPRILTHSLPWLILRQFWNKQSHKSSQFRLTQSSARINVRAARHHWKSQSFLR